MTEDICSCVGECLVFPLIEGETRWPSWLRCIIYVVALAYCFIGVSIVADIFMGSIEAITSRRRQVQLPSGKISTARVWNDAVANLTLMALGSSAPEILLAVIDLFKRDMTMGELGPQTIVGSASFNLFIIVGICIFVIPSTESRYVRHVPVFVVTTVFMFFAYIWLVFSISISTPGIIDIWEAAVTLLALPVLVFISYFADIGMLTCCGPGGRSGSTIEAEDVGELMDLVGSHDRDTREMCKIALALRPKGSPPLAEMSPTEREQMRKMVLKGKCPKRSRAARRVEATRALTGGRRVSFEVSSTFEDVQAKVAGVTGASIQDIPLACAKGVGKPTVQFASASQTMSSDLSTKQVVVKRDGKFNPEVSIVLYLTVSPLFKQDVFIAMRSFRSSMTDQAGRKPRRTESGNKQSATLQLSRHEMTKTLTVNRPQGDADRITGFLVDIVGFEVLGRVEEDPSSHVELGQITSTEVEIGRPEIKGVLAFCFERIMVQGTADKQKLEVLVQRQFGCSGTVSCSYRTERLSAVPGHDYQEVEGDLVFEEGVTEQFIEIEILPKGRRENKDQFLLVLDHAEGGAVFSAAHDGGEETEICTVTIAMLTGFEQSRYSAFLRSVDAAMNFDALRLGNAEWKEAFTSALYCNGGAEEQEGASKVDWAFHILALPWKVFFSLIPPTAYFHGWACFWVSLIFIGVCTVFIGDLAELFGCVLGVDDTITAIIFVALGTSMPDLFASRTAATQDPFADASIVNVTGSNSVNVFLGLGLPWTIGAIYWTAKGSTDEWTANNPEVAMQLGPGEARFTVVQDGLVFSVCVFCCGAVLSMFILGVRRHVVGAELGGPFPLKVASSVTLILFWFLDVGLVSWHTVRADRASTTELVVVISAVVAAAFALLGLTLGTACRRASTTSGYGSESSDKEAPAQQAPGTDSITSLKEADPPQEIGVQCSV